MAATSTFFDLATDLIELEEAAGIAGETPEHFWMWCRANRPESGIYPAPHGWPNAPSSWIWNGEGARGPRWKRGWRWRRFEVEKAVEERDRRSAFRR